jgi:hypothetical protein
MRWPKPSDVAALWRYEFRLDLRAIVRFVREHPEAVILGLGALFRVVTYLWNRAMWLDESSLRYNVVDVPILRFSEPLSGDQMAPMGFLIAERALASFVGSRNYVLRSLPLAAGIAGLFLFSRLAVRVLSRRPAIVALMLFAFSDDLIYYSSEFKPYALDLAFGLGIGLVTVESLGRAPSRRRIAWMGILLVVSPWFSFASIFVVAGCGIVLLADAREARSALLWIVMGLGWLANFAIAYQASRALLSPYTTMYFFWDFAFLPLGLPPTSDGLLKSAGLVLEVFANPLNLLTPGGWRVGVILPLLLLVAGGFSLARRSWRFFLLLGSPIALAMAASVTRHYPFHGRLLLELVPAVFLLIADGTEWFAHQFPSRGELAYKTLLVVLLAYPSWDAVYQCTGRRERPFNRHGDLHPNVFIDQDFRPAGTKTSDGPVTR